MADASEARQWLRENLAGHASGGEFYLLDSYDHGPGRRPDISLNGDDEDTADVLGEILDDDETALDSGNGIGCHGGTALSRGSVAAFLHDLVLRACAWLGQDAADVDRSG
jgi:hypothetical protein